MDTIDNNVIINAEIYITIISTYDGIGYLVDLNGDKTYKPTYTFIYRGGNTL